MAENSVKQEATSAPATISDIFSGICLGLLVGGLVGLSVSPVSGDLLAGLVAVLAAFFGLGGKLPSSTGITKIRLLTFSIGVLVSVPGAILIRTNGILEPSFGHRVQEYQAANLSPELAQELAIFDQTGLRVGSLALSPEPKLNLRNSGVAFSSVAASQCSSLEDAAFESSTLRLQAMAKSSEPWRQAGQFGMALPMSQQVAFADFIHELLC